MGGIVPSPGSGSRPYFSLGGGQKGAAAVKRSMLTAAVTAGVALSLIGASGRAQTPSPGTTQPGTQQGGSAGSQQGSSAGGQQDQSSGGQQGQSSGGQQNG